MNKCMPLKWIFLVSFTHKPQSVFFLRSRCLMTWFSVFDSVDCLWCCCNSSPHPSAVTGAIVAHLFFALYSSLTAVLALLFRLACFLAYQKDWLNSIPQGHRIKAVYATVFPVTIVTRSLFPLSAVASSCSSISCLLVISLLQCVSICNSF